MLNEVVLQDIVKNGEYRRAQGLLQGNRQYKQRDRYTAERAQGLQETALAEYDWTFESVQLGAMDDAEENAQYLLGSSPMVKALGPDRVMDLQEVVEYARALREPDRFVLELGKEYVVSALQTLYHRTGQLVRKIAQRERLEQKSGDLATTEEMWFAQGEN